MRTTVYEITFRHWQNYLRRRRFDHPIRTWLQFPIWNKLRVMIDAFNADNLLVTLQELSQGWSRPIRRRCGGYSGIAANHQPLGQLMTAIIRTQHPRRRRAVACRA